MVRRGQMALPYQAHAQDDGEGEAQTETSLFGDSDNWSDSEPEQETRKHDRSKRGDYLPRNPSRFADRFSRSHGNETYADLDDSVDPRHMRQAGGEIYMRGENPFTQAKPPGSRPPSYPHNPFDPQPTSQHPPPPPPPYNSGWNGSPFGAAPMGPPPAQQPYFPPYTAPLVWNGDPTGQDVNTAPPPRPPRTSYVPPAPNHYHTHPQAPLASYDDDRQYGDNPMLPRSQQAHRSAPAPARRPKQRQASTAASSRVEYELEQVQQQLKDVLLDKKREQNRHDEIRRRGQDAATREADRKREVELLRLEMEKSIKTGFNELRDELRLRNSEIQSEPARGPALLDPRMRGYSDSAADWSPSGGRGEGNTDLLRQEIAKMVDAKRRYELQSRLGSVLAGQGGGYKHWVESERRSMAGSQAGSEYLRSEIEAVLIDTLRDINISGPGDYRFHPGPTPQRPASDGHARSWHPSHYRSRTTAPSDHPFLSQTPLSRESFDSSTYPEPSIPPHENTEAQWAGQLPRSTGRSQARRAARREPSGQASGTRPPEKFAPASTNTSVHPMSGARSGHPDGGRRGPYQEMGGNGRVASNFPANQARTRSQHDHGKNSTYPREEREYEEEYGSGLESDGPEVFPKREPAYPTVPAGHPHLREDFTPPFVPEPGPYLRDAGIVDPRDIIY